MDVFTEEQFSGKVVDHLGLVAATIHKLGIIDRIDQYIPVSKEKGAKVTMGERVAAMILNGLGFMDNRLYMFPEFLENKPVNRLLGENLCSEDFNDDVLGRCLDGIHEYGITHLFSQLAYSIGVEQNLLGQSAHFDTSSLSMFGDYDIPDVESVAAESTIPVSEVKIELSEQQASNIVAADESLIPKTPKITYGYSKDHRPDLKQVVINLATTGAAGFPVWMESHSGNASDKKILREAAMRMQAFCKELKKSPSFLYVADSAMYESCLKDAGDLLWLSRVPERIKVAKELLQRSDDDFCWTQQDNGYRICVIENQYGGQHQRWCIVSSEQAYHREIKTLDRAIAKEFEAAKTALWHLSCKEFGCEKDALTELARFKKTLKYHLPSVETVEIKKHKSKGRPKKDEIPEVVGYKLQGKLLRNEDNIGKTRRQKGRFILATNQLDREQLCDNKILPEYKEQSKTESGFKFIKDDTFEVSSIFLKKPSRISALMMVMTLCLMVYSVAQYDLRKCLEEANDTIPDQLKKPTKKPTLKRVFKLFHGVQILTIKVNDYIQELVINMNDILKKIVRYFGPRAMSIYSLSG